MNNTEDNTKNSYPMVDATYSPAAKAWMERKHLELYETFASLMQEIESRPGMTAKQVKQSDAYQGARKFYATFLHWVLDEAAEFNYGFGGKARQEKPDMVEQKQEF